MMRDTDRLFSEAFDMVIVGGGIYGATLAYKAVNEGYSVALVEKQDFGCGTSANTLGTLHGGLRYLQHLDIGRMRESTQSRNFFLRFAPQFIDIMPFLIPLWGIGIKGPAVLQAGLLVNALISADRNRGISSDKSIPIGSIISKQALTNIVGDQSIGNANSGGLWYEAVMNNPQALVEELIKSAQTRNACCVNKLEATSLPIKSDTVDGLECLDLDSGQTKTVKTRLVIDTSGINIGKLSAGVGSPPKVTTRWCRAINMIVDRPLFDNRTAVGLPYRDELEDKASKTSDGERFLFFLPQFNRTLIGTFYQVGDNDNELIPDEELKKSILDAVNRIYSGQAIEVGEVDHWHSGWLPLSEQAEGQQLDLAKDHNIRFVKKQQVKTGLIEVTGVKFTTAPAVADEVLSLIKKANCSVG